MSLPVTLTLDPLQMTITVHFAQPLLLIVYFVFACSILYFIFLQNFCFLFLIFSIFKIAQTHHNKFHVCLNLLGNKPDYNVQQTHYSRSTLVLSGAVWVLVFHKRDTVIRTFTASKV